MAISHLLAHHAWPRRPRRSFPSRRACRAILSTCEISRGSVSRFAATRRTAFCALATRKSASSSRGESSARRHERHEQPTGQTVNVIGANASPQRNPAKQGVFSLFRSARGKLCPRLVPHGASCARFFVCPVCPMTLIVPFRCARLCQRNLKAPGLRERASVPARCAQAYASPERRGRMIAWSAADQRRHGFWFACRLRFAVVARTKGRLPRHLPHRKMRRLRSVPVARRWMSPALNGPEHGRAAYSGRPTTTIFNPRTRRRELRISQGSGCDSVRGVAGGRSPGVKFLTYLVRLPCGHPTLGTHV